MASASKKRKLSGGQRQRVQQIRDEDERPAEPEDEPSLLAEHLLDKWSWGDMSAQDAQTIAQLVMDDFDKQRDTAKLRALANAGCQGKYKNKCYQAVLKIAERGLRLADPFLARFPFKAPWTSVLQAVLLPHILFSNIYHQYAATWRKSVCPSEDVLERFWTDMVDSGNPNVRGVLTRRRNWKRRCVPLAVHGDGVPVTGVGKGWTQTVTNWSWYSLVATGVATVDALFFIYAMYDKMRVHAKDLTGTAHHFFLVLKWSFDIMWKGVFPSHNYMGQAQLGFSNGMVFLMPRWGFSFCKYL